jgi:hypothetical protein
MILDFYISFGLIVLLSSFFQIINFRKIYFAKEWYNKFIQITKRKPTVVDFRTKSDYDFLTRNNVLMIFDFVWLSGLIFSQFWSYSVIFIIFNFITNFISLKFNYNFFSKIFMFLRVLIKSTIVIVIISKYFFNLL